LNKTTGDMRSFQKLLSSFKDALIHVGPATQHHVHYVRPACGRKLLQVMTVGAHIFYLILARGGFPGLVPR
jgi:hypothetical protein